MQIKTEQGDLLGISRYFTTTFVDVHGEKTLQKDKGSFKCVTCVGGEGMIGDEKISLGDSYLVTAGKGAVQLKGNMRLIMAEVRKYFVGIDFGGTFIKGGIVDDLGNIIYSDKTPTESEKGAYKVSENIAA